MLGFVGMRELSNNTKKVMMRLRQKGSLILTDNGKPIAALIPIKEEENGFEEVYELVKRYEFESTLQSIVDSNRNNPSRNMTMEEIDAEIAKARKERHEREKKK